MQLSLHIIRTLEKRVMFHKDLCHVDTIYGQVQRYVPIGFIFPVMQNLFKQYNCSSICLPHRF